MGVCIYPGSGCNSPADCDDGIFCNGEEYCSIGQCYSGVAVDCGFAFICDEESTSCIRDCDAFDIDEYLECSSSFGAVQSGIDHINLRVGGIGWSVDNLGTEINNLETKITTNEGGIDEADLKIEELYRQYNDTNDKINRFGVDYEPGPNSNANADNIHNLMDDVNGDSKYLMIGILQTKDFLIIGLLIINMLLTIYNCIYKNNRNSKVEIHSKIDDEF